MNVIIKKSLSELWVKTLLFFTVGYVLVPVSPLTMHSVNTDSGVFLYIGWRILHGEVPYRDIWDHKPPLVYFINALGLAFSGNSRWGVWLLEFLFVFLAALIGYRLFKQISGRGVAALSSIIWILSLTLMLNGGNFTEEYALPVQFLIFWLAKDINLSRNWLGRLFLIGLLGGISFLIKQTTIGIILAVVLYLLISRVSSHRLKQLAGEYLFILLGITLAFLPLIIYLGVYRAWTPFIEQVWNYNLVYSSSGTGFLSHLSSILFTVNPLTLSVAFYLGLLGYFISMRKLLLVGGSIEKCSPILLIGLINLPIELLLVNISGLKYEHYFITLLPVLAVFSAVAFSWFSGWKLKINRRLTLGFKILFLGIISGILLLVFHNRLDSYQDQPYKEITGYIEKNSDADDTILVWGAETSINYLASRKSPARYVYQIPLYREAYVNEKMIDDLLTDIIINKPIIIVDSNDSTLPLFDFPLENEEQNRKISLIKSGYVQGKLLNNWTIYSRKTDNP